MTHSSDASSAHSTACILCSQNCGIRVEADGKRLTRITGDPQHPASKGYLCEKASQLDYYQSGEHRITTPLRRRPDGSFEEVDWDTAITGIAAEVVRLRDTHGGHVLAHNGACGQGNHLGGCYAFALHSAMQTRFFYSAFGQEKTGGFWVDGRLYGRQDCHPGEGVEQSDYVLFIGTNPWQSHGLQRARSVLLELMGDPDRTMVVIDPRQSETALRADIHLQVRPGGDAQLMLAMLAVMVEEDLVDHEFLEQRTHGYLELAQLLAGISIEDMCRGAGVDCALVRRVARGFCGARSGCVRVELGLEHSPNSTLNIYLSKLLYLLAGHFGKAGGNYLHTFLGPILRDSRDYFQGGRRTPVTGAPEFGGIYPPAVIPEEIDSDHPDRLRGLFVDNTNPLRTGAGGAATLRAYSKLELLVVTDVALTETARVADWVLPTPSQYEKWECTFFNLEFPSNFFHLRAPVATAPDGPLPEPEIYRRILVAMGELPDRFPRLESVARWDRKRPWLKLYPLALAATLLAKPRWAKYASAIAYTTLGKALPDGAASASVLWFFSHQFVWKHRRAVRRAGIKARHGSLAEGLFHAILTQRSGLIMSAHREGEMWSLMGHSDQKVSLVIPELFDVIENLEEDERDPEYPLVLLAGERRAYHANTIIRHEGRRRLGSDGGVKIHPDDAASAGICAGDSLLCESRTGSFVALALITDKIPAGVLSAPNGFGLAAEGADAVQPNGPALNAVTAQSNTDSISRVPLYKHTPVRIRRAASTPA